MALASKYEISDATRRSLLSRVKNPDDQESWETFFKKYSRLVYSVATKAGLNHTEAEEAVQETFITLMRSMPHFKYDPSKSFKSWLIHTAQFKVLDQFRKRKRHLKSASKGAEARTATIERIADPASLNVESILEDEWREHMFKAAVERVKQQVTASQYQIFDLYVLKKWSVSKIASTLGISSGKVYLAKHRIAKLVKRELDVLKSKSE